MSLLKGYTRHLQKRKKKYAKSLVLQAQQHFLFRESKTCVFTRIYKNIAQNEGSTETIPLLFFACISQPLRAEDAPMMHQGMTNMS